MKKKTSIIEQKTIKIAEIPIEFMRKKVKSMRISIYPSSGLIRLVVPVKISEEVALKFVETKLEWIKKHSTASKTSEQERKINYTENDLFYFKGKPHLLKLKEQTIGKNKVILKEEENIELHLKPNTSLEKRALLLDKWYRAELKKVVSPMITKWEPIIGVNINEWRIKQMTTRWGTCNIMEKRIWLNLELIKKPLHCLEYIVVHEMVHLLEASHNRRFWSLMTQFMPDWKLYKDELNRFNT